MIAVTVEGRRLVVRDTARITCVDEVARNGRVVRTLRFPTRRVLSVEDQPVRRPPRQRQPREAPGQTHIDDFLGREQEAAVAAPTPAT